MTHEKWCAATPPVGGACDCGADLDEAIAEAMKGPAPREPSKYAVMAKAKKRLKGDK